MGGKIILLICMILSCSNKQAPKDHISARKFFKNGSCLNTLKKHMKKSGCPELRFEETKYQILFRCNKPDKERGLFWDNYITNRVVGGEFLR